MSEATSLTVPRYVYRSVERALATAKQRVRVANLRVEQLESTLAAMHVGKNGGENINVAVNDNTSESATQIRDLVEDEAADSDE